MCPNCNNKMSEVLVLFSSMENIRIHVGERKLKRGLFSTKEKLRWEDIIRESSVDGARPCYFCTNCNTIAFRLNDDLKNLMDDEKNFC